VLLKLLDITYMQLIVLAIGQPLSCHPEPGLHELNYTHKLSGWRISRDISMRSLLRRDDRWVVDE